MSRRGKKSLRRAIASLARAIQRAQVEDVVPEQPHARAMRWPFGVVTRELCGAIRRLAILDGVDVTLSAGDLDPRSLLPIVTVTLRREDLDEHHRLTPAALDRVRDQASALAHDVNFAAPPGVRWAVRLLAELHSRSNTVAVLAVEWAIVPAVATTGAAEA